MAPTIETGYERLKDLNQWRFSKDEVRKSGRELVRYITLPEQRYREHLEKSIGEVSKLVSVHLRFPAEYYDKIFKPVYIKPPGSWGESLTFPKYYYVKSDKMSGSRKLFTGISTCFKENLSPDFSHAVDFFSREKGVNIINDRNVYFPSKRFEDEPELNVFLEENVWRGALFGDEGNMAVVSRLPHGRINIASILEYGFPRDIDEGTKRILDILEETQADTSGSDV